MTNFEKVGLFMKTFGQEVKNKPSFSSEKINHLIKKLNIDLNQPITTTCGSGVTACALSLGLFLIGKTDVAVYDGSWSEWGALSDTSIVQ